MDYRNPMKISYYILTSIYLVTIQNSIINGQETLLQYENIKEWAERTFLLTDKDFTLSLKNIENQFPETATRTLIQN